MNWWAYARLAAATIASRLALRVSVGDVIGDGVLEEDRLLDDHADLAAEAPELDVADVVAVDPDRPGIDVPEAREQVHQGGLAAAVGADQRDGFAVPDAEAHAVEHGGCPVVAEGRPGRTRWPGDAAAGGRVLEVGDPWGPVHQGADPIGGGRGPLDLRVHVRQLPDRVGNPGEHGVERKAGPAIAMGWAASWSRKRPRSR